MSIVSSIFGGGTPSLPPAPAPPISNQSNIDARNEASLDERRKRLAAGRASTILSDSTGDTSSPNLASKSLLGA